MFKQVLDISDISEIGCFEHRCFAIFVHFVDVTASVC
jgi:hypothetical protein